MVDETAMNRDDEVWYLAVINVILSSYCDVSIQYHNDLIAQEDEQEITDNQTIASASRCICKFVSTMQSDLSSRFASTANGQEMSLFSLGNHNKLTLTHGLFSTINKLIKVNKKDKFVCLFIYIINNETLLASALEAVQQHASIYHKLPLSDVVTHLYYTGRFHASRDRLKEAKQKLVKALELCHPNAVNNKVRILLLLIPIQLLFGVFPKRELLIKYGLLSRFEPIIKALRTGNVMLFRNVLSHYENDFINTECYLILQRSELIVVRQLIYRVYNVRAAFLKQMGGHCNFKKANMIPLKQIVYALQIMNSQYFDIYAKRWCSFHSFFYVHIWRDYNIYCIYIYICMIFLIFFLKKESDDTYVDEDEVECLLSILISKKLLSGYVAQGKALVLGNPPDFPHFADIAHNEWWKTDI
ncbi:hypothetical protein RFI_04862 [Reticulomyxa filosa]|uniref:PCI domain-containing protein n=1 Tax=Reticulomyxa filosa TaxID=46433 RepID=X6P289_RETFI|nr:hypothetical protein RFI_04862 [Reticulomyxa filosa]|eukprot:ETO32253.1 hypothetical protein RFI_04862 [Reticulomyxa filosa]